MFGWIKRLGRKKPDIHRSMGAVRASEDATASNEKLTNSEQWNRRFAADYELNLHLMIAHELRCAIAHAKRQKKKHSHLSAELARLEQADRSPTHMIQEPGQ